jgi:hypothetical protein
MPVRFVGAITALNCAWFILNIIGLGWLFLANAISYIQPQSRERLIRRYIANFAWQRQLREIMAHNRLFNAVLYGYLPRGADGPENGHIHRKGNAEVAVSPFFRDMGEIGAETHLRGQQVLHDVRLPMLAVVAQAWLDRAQADNGLAPERRTEPLTPDAPRLIFMPIPGETYSGVLPLARVEHGPPLDWADRILVSLAYRFRSPPRVLTPPKTEALVKEAVTDLLALVALAAGAPRCRN